MATALKERQIGAPDAADTAQAQTWENERFPVRRHPPDVLPERYIVREMSFLMDSDGLQFLYKDSALAWPLPEKKIDPVIPRFTRPVSPMIGLSGAGLATAETPLDLSITGGPAFLIFKLDPRLNWRFSQSLPAITHKKEADSACYGGLTYVDQHGVYSDSPIAECRLVFLVTDPPEGDYRHGFNFNVELIQKPHVGQYEPRILPVEIDPDIRFPGGSLT